MRRDYLSDFFFFKDCKSRLFVSSFHSLLPSFSYPSSETLLYKTAKAGSMSSFSVGIGGSMHRVQTVVGSCSLFLILKKKVVKGRLLAFVTSQHLHPLPWFEVMFAD